MNAAYHDVLIVGAGHGGATSAIALRQRGFAGSVALLGDEAEFPYERPPLSKEYLAGEKPFDRLLIRPATFWRERDIALLPGRRVMAVDPVAHRVVTVDGPDIEYGKLVWAAGGSPRRLICDGHAVAGVHSVRNRADVDRMVAELPVTRRVVVVGGGYIGLEAASVLIKLGKAVTVLEAQDRVLARVAGVEISRFVEAEHRARGVQIHHGATVACIEDRDGTVSGVRLANGDLIECEMVIVGIGITPAVEPLTKAGAEGENGVLVDAFGATSLPDIYAVGDCAAHRNPFAEDAVIRLESVQNAADQATTVATALTGSPKPYTATPWFWSNQYDLKLQTVGLSHGYDDEILRGDPSTKSFSVIYLRSGRVVTIDCISATRDFVQGRAMVEKRACVDKDRLTDFNVPLKSLMEL